MSQIAFETPSRPRSWTRPARRSTLVSSSARPSCTAVAAASSDTALACPSVYGDLRSTKSASASSAWSKAAPERVTRSAGSASITAFQVRPGVEPAEDLVRSGAEGRRQRRVELQAGAAFGQRDGCFDPAEPVRDLDELRELGQTRRDRDAVAGETAGPAFAVPLLVRGADRLLHLLRQAEPLRQGPRDRRVPGDHPVEIVAAGDRELEPHPDAVQRRVAAPDQRHHRGDRAHAPKVAVVLGGLERDVVAEPLRLLVRVGVAADVDEQRRVVDGGALGLLEPDPVGEPQRDHALAQHVLHRLAEAEIDAERERRDELREPHLRHGPTMDHHASTELI